jgi:hypothetical protein
MCALIIGSYFKCTPGPGRRFLENQGNILASQTLLLGIGIFGRFQVSRKIQQETDLLGCKVKQFQKTPITEIRGHKSNI